MNFDCDCDGVVNRIHFIRFDVQCTNICDLCYRYWKENEKKKIFRAKLLYHQWENYNWNTLLKIELLLFVKISIYLTLCMKDLKWNICVFETSSKLIKFFGSCCTYIYCIHILCTREFTRINHLFYMFTSWYMYICLLVVCGIVVVFLLIIINHNKHYWFQSMIQKCQRDVPTDYNNKCAKHRTLPWELNYKICVSDSDYSNLSQLSVSLV